MMAPPPNNPLEAHLREEINVALSGSCSSAITAPLFLLSRDETDFVDCQSGLPDSDANLFKKEEEDGKPSTYGEVTLLGSYSKVVVLPVSFYF
jgi:hypothetical protein